MSLLNYDPIKAAEEQRARQAAALQSWDKAEAAWSSASREQQATMVKPKDNLDETTGQVALAYRIADGTPWHEKGHPMTAAEAQDLAGALARAQLNWQALTRESGAYFDDGRGFVADPNKRVVYRSDTGAVLATVGTRYRVVDNMKGLGNGALQQLFDSGLAEVVSAGSIFEGREVFLQTIFRPESPIIQQVFGDDAVIPTGLFYNSHDGSKQAGMLLSLWRAICSNSFRLAKQGAIGDVIKVRHTGDTAGKLDAAARKLWAQVFTQIERAAAEAAVLKATHLTPEQLGALVLDLIAPPVPEKDQKTPRQKTFAAKVQERRDRITTLWTEGDGHMGDHSAWEAYQAVTQSFEHDGSLWGRGDSDTRVMSAMHGDIAAKKVQVVTSLLDAALETSEGQTMLDRIVRYNSGDNSDLLKRIVSAN